MNNFDAEDEVDVDTEDEVDFDAEDEVDTVQSSFKPLYWNNKGPHQADYDRLWNKLVPDSGSAETIRGELLRSISKIYYDRYNNGFGNQNNSAAEFIKTQSHKIRPFLKNRQALDNFLKGFEKIGYSENSIGTGKVWKHDEDMEDVVDAIVQYAMDVDSEEKEEGLKESEIYNIDDLLSGMRIGGRSGKAEDKIRDILSGQANIKLNDGSLWKSAGMIRGSNLKKGDIVLASYLAYNQGAQVYEILGVSDMDVQYGEGGVKYDSVRAAMQAMGVISLTQLDAKQDEVAKQKFGEKRVEDWYGHAHYLWVKDLDIGDSGGWFYIHNGRWAIGSGAEALSFIKLEKIQGVQSPEVEALQIQRSKKIEEIKIDPRRSDRPTKPHAETADKFLEVRTAIDDLKQQIAAVHAIIAEKERVAGTLASELLGYAEEYKDRMFKTEKILVQLQDIPAHKAQVPAYKKVIDHLLEKLEAVSKEMRKEGEQFIEDAKREIPGSTELLYKKLESEKRSGSLIAEGWISWRKILNKFKEIALVSRTKLIEIEKSVKDLLTFQGPLPPSGGAMA
jgi:hypothetical protein